jgi:hypothetical protein
VNCEGVAVEKPEGQIAEAVNSRPSSEEIDKGGDICPL